MHAAVARGSWFVGVVCEVHAEAYERGKPRGRELEPALTHAREKDKAKRPVGCSWAPGLQGLEVDEEKASHWACSRLELG